MSGIIFAALGLQAQELLNFQESPPGGGVLVAQDDDSYAGTGSGAGKQYLLNGEGGDVLTLLVQTALGAGSSPRIRLADGDDAQLANVLGSSSGRVVLQSYVLPSPGVYRLNIYSDSAASAFTLRGLLGRNVLLETENNDLPTLADSLAVLPQPGGYQLSVAGVLEFNPDHFDLGELAAGSGVSASIQVPNGSALSASGVELSLFKDSDSTPVTSVTGTALNESISQAGNYSLRVRIPGVDGLHMSFDGAGDFVNLGDPASLRITGSQTIEFWIKPRDFAARRNPVNKAYGGEGTMTIETNGTVTYFYGTSGTNASPYQAFGSGIALRAGEWQHVALVRDLDAVPPKLNWYIDGRKTAEADALYVPAVASSNDFLVGDGYTSPLAGEMDELRIWNAARTQQELIDNLDNTLAGTETGLVSYYKFEENGGVTLTDATTNNDGAISGAPAWEGIASSEAVHAASQGTTAIYLLEVDVTDATNPAVADFEPTPVPGYLFDGTSAAPSNMTALRGNNDTSYLYTLTGSTGGTAWGTDLYRDDSSLGRAAVHAGVLRVGETGPVKVTIKPATSGYLGSVRHGISSVGAGSGPGSYIVERYDPPAPFTLSGLYRSFYVQFTELMDAATLPGAIEITGAGPNDTFGDSDDLVFTENIIEITHDNRVRLDLGGAVLPPGQFRLTVAGSVADRAGNTLGSSYVENFTIPVATQNGIEFVNEDADGDNGSFATADPVSLNVMEGVNDGSFVNPGLVRSANGNNPYDVELEDLDGDGHLDAAVLYLGSDGMRIFPGTGDGTFGTPQEFPLPGDTRDMELFDLDNDLDLDAVVVVSGQDRVDLFRNESTPGTINFVAAGSVTVGDDPVRVRSGKINADGFMDLVVSNYGANATTGRNVSVLLNDQGGGFTEAKVGLSLSPRVRAYGVALGLLNNDAHLDLVAGDYDSDDRIVVWLGNGDGSFGAPAYYAFPTNYEPIDITLADYDQDGDLDAGVAAHSGSSQRVYFYPGNGDGTFGAYVEHHLGRGADLNFLKAPDLNGDSWPDVITGDGSRLFVLTNRAEGGFGFARANWALGSTYGFDAGDVNEDGRVDLAVAIYNTHQLRILTGNAKSLLSADDTLTGVMHGYGRGNLTNTSDNDYFSFSAQRGQRLTVAVDNTALPGTNLYTRFILYNSEGVQISDNYMGSSGNRAGQSLPYTIPRDGTYYIRFLNWGSYSGEYRFRVSLSPNEAVVESENNDSIGNADTVSFSLAGNQRTAKMFGYVGIYDTGGDYYNLRNLAEGTEIDLTLALPSTSTLVPILEIFDSAGAVMAAGNPGDTLLSYTLSPGEEDTYYARVRASSGRGIMAEYLLQLGITDLQPPVITGSDLPTGTLDSLVEGFGLTFNKDMLASSVVDGGNYSLISAGPDNLFSSPDDVAYAVSPASYSSGLAASYSIPGGPLAPGMYQFRAFNLQDTFGNILPVPFEAEFTIAQVPGFTSESESNNTVGSAETLVFNAEVAGMLTAGGRGRLSSGADRDYWQFDAEAGDLLVFETLVPEAPNNQGLRWYLTDPSGGVVLDRYVGHSNYIETLPAVTLPETGLYTFWVDDWYGLRTEYRFRVTLVRALQYESEDNDGIPFSNQLTFTTTNNIEAADVAGFLGRNTELDYFNLGPIAAGNTVFLSVTLPDGSELIPIVAVYRDNGVLQAETNGVEGDDSAEVQISNSDTYHALVRPNLTSAGMMSQYVLNVRVLPTNAVNFPNLRVTNVADPPASGTQSGGVVTINFDVQNVGNLATGATAWTDRVVLSRNDAYGDGDDVQLALVPRSGALNPSEAYSVNQSAMIPDGLFGDFYVFVETDASNAVDEILQEGDNVSRSPSQFNIALRDYPDLVIENLVVAGPDGSNNFDISWDLANRGAGSAPAGSLVNLQVINTTTAQTLVDIDLSSTLVLALDALEAQMQTVNATAPGFYVVTVTADPDNTLYEYGALGHGTAEINSVQANFQIFQFYDVAVAAQPPAGGSVTGDGTYREGEAVTVTATADTSVLPYAFINWTENGAFVSSSPAYQFTAGSDRDLIAVFGLPQFQIGGTVSPSNSGSISGLGSYSLNANATVTALPAPGWLFDRWEENNATISNNAQLQFAVTGARTLDAFFMEATPSHDVVIATDPPGVAAIPGSGNYTNGQSINPAAPTPVEDGDVEHLFSRWELNGLFLTTDPMFAKTFSTLDPAVMNYVAKYEQRSLKPEVVSVATNYGTLVPLADDVVFTVTFDRAMDTSVLPVLALQSGNAPQTPVIAPGGQWAGNSTYLSPPVNFGDQNGGAYTLTITSATDGDARVMDPDSSFGFTVDSLPPPNPTIVLEASTTDSATISWAGYPAPVDLSGFRYYLETTDFTSVDGLSAVSGGNLNARAFAFPGLQPDQEYFAAVTAIDVAGNSDPLVTTLRIELTSVAPPPVPLVLTNTGLDSVHIDWSAYDTSGLVGFDGFRLFVDTTPFTDVGGLTPVADLEETVTNYELSGLDRTRTYHIAVVGYSRLDQFESAVTPSQWSDPLSGSIASDLSVGGVGRTIEVLASATVENGATLTIAPGTTLRFAPGTGLTVVDGRLLSTGTALEPIHFTSVHEDDPGTSAARGDWLGLMLSDPVNVSEVNHTWVRFGGGLQVLDGTPVVNNLYAVQNAGAGLTLDGTATLSSTGNYLAFNENGLVVNGDANLAISQSVIQNNTTTNVTHDTEGGGAVSAEENWWGSTSAATIASKISGAVTSTNPLMEEPVLGAALATASGDTLTGTQTLDLRIMSVNAISARLSEDSLFGGVLFDDLFLPDETFRVSPYGFVVPFTLSPGAGLKTAFLQFRSPTDATSSTLALDINFVTDGPVVTSFSLVEGEVVTRPLTVSAAATAALGLKEIEFRVAGSLAARTPSSPLNFLWDPRGLPTEIVRVEALARDLAGNVSTRSVNVSIVPTPPPAPVITSPANGIVVASSTVVVSGTAEPGISLRVSRNGAVVGNVTANVAGQFTFPDVSLVEGANNLIVTAFDSVGTTPSAVRTIFLDSGPPAELILDPPAYNPSNRRLTLLWRFMETGERPTSFRVFWKDTPFSDPAEATGQSVVTDQTQIALTSLPDGTYHFGVVGYDDAGNAGMISNLQQFAADFSSPQMTISYGASLPVGPGILPITLTSTEALMAPPLLTIRPVGLQAISVPLTGGPLNFTADYSVSDLSARTGTASVTVSATDVAGNSFVGSPQGPALVFDTTRPTGELVFDSPAPVQTTSPVLLSFGLTLSEPAAAGTVPSLIFDPPVGSNVPITLTGSGQNWSGSLNLTPAMGRGEAFFLMNVMDQAGNTGTVLTTGETLEIYNTAEPDPPGIPLGLAGEIRSGGEFAIGWNAVARAETYSVLRAPGHSGPTPTLVVADGITGTSFVDLPPVDGEYRYAIVAVLRGVEGPPSGILEGLSDRTPPEVPENVNATLLARGVEVTFEAPSGGEPPAKFRIYRNESLIRTLNSPAPVLDLPPRGTYDYSVASVDAHGNESRSAPVQIDLLVSAVTNLQILVKEGQANALTWVSTDATVTGFHVYRDDVRQTGAPLTDPFYIDPLATGLDAVTYAVSAVNGNGDESVRRSLVAYPVEVGLVVNPDPAGTPQQSRVRYFESYGLDITNKSSTGMLELSAYEINRTVGGGDALSIGGDLSLDIAPNTKMSQDLVLPSPTSRMDTQLMQVLLQTAPDSGGSSVSYESVFTASRAVDLGTNVILAPRDVPLAGGLTDFDVQIFNNGYAPMDVIMARGGGNDPGDVSIAVLDESGVEVSRTGFKGVSVPGVSADGQGNFFVTILPGASVTFTIPDVFVPVILAGAGENTEFEVTVEDVYHGLALGDPVVSGPLTGSTRSNLIETPYYGTCTTDKSAYANIETVMITGQAIDRDSGLPVPDVPLRIGFGARGYVVYEEITTDASGNYQFDYTPPVGFSGGLNIWAAHPLIVDQLNQVTIEYLRMYVTPQSAEIVMSENDTLDFNLVLINPGDTPLSGVVPSARIFVLDEFGAEVDITEIRLDLIGDPVDLDPNKRASIPLRLTAETGAPADAMMEVGLVSQEGAGAAFRSTISLRPAVPTLSFVQPQVGYVDMSVSRGEINSQIVTLENLGLRPLEGVEMIVPQNLSWMSVNLPRESDGRILLPDVPVGGRLSFTVVYTPPPGLPLGLYDDFLLIRGANAVSDFQVNLFAQITSSETGSVKFVVDNIFVERVPNAKVRLRNPNLRQELGPFFTDANGELLVPDLQEGPWSWKVTSAGHASAAGTVEVLANQTVLVEKRLSKSLVTVEFTVVPVPFTDRYEIVIEQTFQTRVPFPVLVMDPPSFDLQNLPDEFETTLIVTLKNEGLIRMFDCTVEGSSLFDSSFTPLITYFPELLPQQEVQVPFKFRFQNGGLTMQLFMDETGALSANFSDCANAVLNPADFAAGLAAIAARAEGQAQCLDGAPAFADATTVLKYAGAVAVVAGALDPFVILAQIVGCTVGSLFSDGGGGGGGNPGGTGGPGGGGGGGPFTGAYCFVAGTPVTLSDRSVIAVEWLEAGQEVLTSASANRSGKVTDVIVRTSGDLLELTAKPALSGQDLPELTLQLTGDHVVWSDQRGWTAARNLQAGEWLHHDRGGLYEVVTLKPLEGEHTVYTVDVEGDSAFYANHLLVQDLCGYQKAGDRSILTGRSIPVPEAPPATGPPPGGDNPALPGEKASSARTQSQPVGK